VTAPLPTITYEPGDVAKIGGFVALRVLGGWAFADGSRLRDDQLVHREPTPLVLKGRPVNAA
jgi:hypothetical protein